jgi:phosphoserine aminotransferase
MITFYPGPSKVSNKVLNYLRDAFLDGVLSINHRSPEFEQIYEDCVKNLREKLLIPEDYIVLFTSSATECWEIIAQSLIDRESYHIYNGAFGEKWFEYTQKIKPEAKGARFDMQIELEVDKLQVPPTAELLAITHNETSNGTAVGYSTLAKLRKAYPDQLIAVDATSSMAGVRLDFELADIWYASVQKCFGLPAGLAVMICSPRTLERAAQINENSHYNSFLFMVEKMRLNQTSYTPNVLNIYLLMRVMEIAPSIMETEAKTILRYTDWVNFFKSLESVHLLIENEWVRSRTVLTIAAPADIVKETKASAKRAGIVLGSGYGDLKSTTFRIANFPAIKTKEINLLMEFFSEHLR